VSDDLEGKIGLGTGTVAAVRGWSFGYRGVITMGPSLGGGAVDLALEGGELLAQQLELHLGGHVVAAKTGDFSSKPGVFLLEIDDRLLEEDGCLSEGVSILDVLQPRHAQFLQAFRDPSSI